MLLLLLLPSVLQLPQRWRPLRRCRLLLWLPAFLQPLLLVLRWRWRRRRLLSLLPAFLQLLLLGRRRRRTRMFLFLLAPPILPLSC